MKPQPFNLALWLHLGKPDCVWTRNKEKISEIHIFNKYNPTVAGVINATKGDRAMIWNCDGQPCIDNDESFSKDDLMLCLEPQQKPWILNAPKKVKK